MCIKCYETYDIQITDDGWVPVYHAIHKEIQLAVVRIPVYSEKQRKYFMYLASYLEYAQLPFIYTIYDYFQQNNELILIVRRPQITLNDFFLKSELTDNQNYLAAYSIAMGVFMAHRHKLYVNEFSFRDVLIFEDYYICLSVKYFFKLPCGCWNSQQDLANLAYKCLLLNNMSSISQFPSVFRTCAECGRTTFDLTKLDDVNNVFMRCNNSNSSVFKMSEVVFKELNWPRIVNLTFLSTARISPNVDGSKMLFANQTCKFQQPKSNKRADQQMYESKEITKVMLYTGIRNKNQPNMPPEIMKAANKIASALQIDDDEFLTYLDPLYSPNKKDLTQIDDFQDDYGKFPLDYYLRDTKQVQSGKLSPYEVYMAYKKSDDLQAADESKSQPLKLSSPQCEFLRHYLVQELVEKREHVDLYSVFISTRLLLQNSEFQMRMSDQPFPLDVQFSAQAYNLETLHFPAFLARYSLDDFKFHYNVIEHIIPLIPQYDTGYAACMTQYAGLLAQSLTQSLVAQSLKQSHQFDQYNAPDIDQFCSLRTIDYLNINITELADAQIRFTRALLFAGAPEIAELAGSPELSSSYIVAFVQDSLQIDSYLLYALATCINMLIDLHLAIYCADIVQKRSSVEFSKPHPVFNFRDAISPLANSTDEVEEQKLFYHVIFILSFCLFTKQNAQLGAQLLLNAIRPYIMQKFAEHNAACFSERYLFARNVMPDFQQIPRTSEYYAMYQELCQNVVTICSCNDKKTLCGYCSIQTNVLKQRRADNQRTMLHCEAAIGLQYLLLQLLVDFKRNVLQHIDSDPNVGAILYSALRFDVPQLQKMSEYFCDFEVEGSAVVSYLAHLDEKTAKHYTIKLCAALLRNIDTIDDSVFDLNAFCMKIMNIAKRLFTTGGENHYVTLYYVLNLLKNIIHIYIRRIAAFQADVVSFKAEELLRKYNYIDFSDYAYYLQRVLNITQDMLAFFEFDENMIDKIAQLSKMSASVVSEVSLFYTRKSGYLDVIIDFAINSLTFCNYYFAMVSSVNYLKESNRQLIASISLVSDRPRLQYHLIFTQSYVTDIINLVVQNPASLQYGFSFQSLQKIIALGASTKLNQQFIMTLATVDYVRKLLLFHDFDTVEAFYVYVLRALRQSSGLYSTIEATSAVSTQRELSSSLMGSYPLPPKTPNVQNMNMSLVKPMSEEFKLLYQQRQQIKASKMQQFLIDSSKVLGRKYLDSTIAFLAEAAFDYLFFDEDAYDPYDLISDVAAQYIYVFTKNGRLPEESVLNDIGYYLAFCRQNSKIVLPFKKFDLMQMTFQASLPEQVLPMLMALLYDQSKEFADVIISRFAHQIIQVYKQETLTITAFHLIYSLIKFCYQSQKPNENYKGLIAEFFKANSGRFNDFSDDFLADVMMLFIKLLERKQIFGFVEAQMPLEILRALNMRSSYQLKDIFLNIFELCKEYDEIRQDFRDNNFNSYLQQTKFDQRYKQIQKQLLVDYKK